MSHSVDYKNIPIFIISYNRLHYLKLLVECLENKGYTNISIIDNKSSYPPLLNYLQNIKHKVFYMDKNYGHKVFWIHESFRKIIETQYYAVTDPDILPIQQCPDDFMEQFYEILQNNPKVQKVGFSLKIDDIPNHNEYKDYIIKWERQFYEKPLESKGYKIYNAPIDTTFALYRPTMDILNDELFYNAIRTGYPYQARHLTWYINQKQLDEESIFYKQHTINGSSTWYDLSDSWIEIINQTRTSKAKQITIKSIKFFINKICINLIPIKSARKRLRNTSNRFIAKIFKLSK